MLPNEVLNDPEILVVDVELLIPRLEERRLTAFVREEEGIVDCRPTWAIAESSYDNFDLFCRSDVLAKPAGFRRHGDPNVIGGSPVRELDRTGGFDVDLERAHSVCRCETFDKFLEVRLVERLSAGKCDVTKISFDSPLDEVALSQWTAALPRIHVVEVGIAMVADFLADGASSEADESHQRASVDAFTLFGDEAFSDLEGGLH